MSFYNTNLEVFKDFSPDLYRELTESKPIYDIDILPLDEQYNYVLKNDNACCNLYSIYDIEYQIKREFKNANHEAETVVLFGFGCGYEVEYLVNNFTKLKNIIIIEPCLELFRDVLNYFDVAELVLSTKTVSIVLNKNLIECRELVSGLVDVFWDSKIEFIYNITYRTIFQDYYEKLIDYVIKNLKRNTINLATLDFLKYEYVYNYFKNINIPAIPIEYLMEKIEGLPFIIVSAGPSLNKNMHLLSEVKDRAIICAVGTSIKILEENGIKPHLRFAFDASKAEKELFHNINDSEIGLIYGNSIHHEILPGYNGPKIRMVMDLEPIVHYILKKSNVEFKAIRSGFSIANVALDIACKCKASKVVFMGQDLCYVDGEFYAKGTKKGPQLDVNNSSFVKMENIYGEAVYTNSAFLGMRNLFESIIEINPAIKFINATEGGINIKGTENRKFNEVLNELNENINVKKVLNEVYESYDADAQFKLVNCINKSIVQLREEIYVIENINNERLNMIRKIYKNIEKNIKMSRIINDLTFLEKYEEELCKIDLYNKAILKHLDMFYKSIELKNKYDEQDKMNMINSKVSIISGKTTLLYQYVDFMKQMVDEY